MMMGPAASKKSGIPLKLDFLAAFVGSSPDPGDEVRFVSTPPAARMGKAFVRSPGCSLDFYPASSPSAPAKHRGKRRREEEEDSDGEFMGMSNEGMLREINEMSDGELERQITGYSRFARLRTGETKERHQRFLPLLQKEARHRRIRKGAAKDGDDRSWGAPSSTNSVFTFAIEDAQVEDHARKYLTKSSAVLPINQKYGQLGVQTRSSSSQIGRRKPITVDKMYSSNTSPTALGGHTQRVRAVDPRERDNGNYRQNENNHYSNHAKRRKAHHEASFLLHQKVNDVVLLDDEDVQPDEPVDCGVPDKWKDLKLYYPSSDDPQAVELSSSDIRCLNPGVYLSSPVINYYIQYIKRAEMHIECGTGKFYMFNTYFYSKLQEALLDKGKFLKLRRWWKGINIFQRGYIILPIHGMSHWSLIIVCISAKESNSGPIILHLDSLGMHPSAEIFDTVGRFLEEEWRHLRKNPPSGISISDAIWQDLPSNIQKEKVEVPGQNNAYDCGVFMLFYIQKFMQQAPESFTRESLDMFSRSWFRSEDASGLRNLIREQLLELFGSAMVDDEVMPEAPASAGSNGDCIIKEGEPEGVTPCDTSEMAVGGGDASTHNEEDAMEVIPLEGTPSTSHASDGRIGDDALAEAATLSNDLKHNDDDDEECIMKGGESGAVTPRGGSEMAVGGGDDTGTRDEGDFMEVRSSSGGTPSPPTRSSDARITGCVLSEAATLSDGIEDGEILPSDPGSSKTEQDVEILPSYGSKNDEEVGHSTADPTMYCPDSCDSDVEEVRAPVAVKRRVRSKCCFVG